MAQVRLSCLLMGKTGEGKSRTGNSLLGKPAFKFSSNVESLTKDVEQDFAEFENYILNIVDGPGLADTAMNSADDKETAATKMAQALAMCDGGVDAFLFVYKYGNKMTDEKRGALEALRKIFGEKYFSNLIVVVTNGDQFIIDMEEEDNGDITFHDWCRKQTGAFRQLFDDCRQRFILFNNREQNKNAMNQQRKEVIELANDVHRISGRYTSETFKEAKALRDRYIIEQKVPILNMEIQEKCGLLNAALAAYMKDANAYDKHKIIESIDATKKKIRDEDKGTDLLKHLLVLVERIEDNLDDVDKLKKLTEELADTRKSKGNWIQYALFVGKVGAVVAPLTFVLPLVSIAASVTSIAANTAVAIKYVCSIKKESRLEEEMNPIRAKLVKAGLTGNQAN